MKRVDAKRAKLRARPNPRGRSTLRERLARSTVAGEKSAGRKSAFTQISARVPGELKMRFDELVERKGLRKEFVIEEALRHHLHALEEFPAEYIIPTRIVLTPQSSREIAAVLEHPAEPTVELTAIFGSHARDGDD